VAALIWSHNPSWTNVQVAAQLLATTDFIDHLNPGFEAELGTGRANSYSALTATLPSPTLKFVNGLPADGTRTGDQTIGDFTLAFDQVLDIDAANNTANYDLRAAGADGVFGTGDDVVKTLTHDQYMLGTNLFEFQMADGPMTYGHYRLTISNLVNAFGEPLDGDGDGFEGDAYVQEFWVLTPDQGIVEFDNTTYRTRDVATITVTDQNFVGNQITVAVSSSAGDSEVVVLNSTGFGTWVGAIQTASGDPSLGDGKLNVADDDVITVVNTDPDDGFGNTFNSSDTALISSVVDFPLTGGPVVLTSSVITSTIEIDEFGAIGDLDLRLDISHGRTADLEVVLIAPDNTRIRLVDSAGGTGADFDNTYFDESAPRSINEGSSPYRGRFRPLESFDALFNKSIRGTWTLEITDDVAGVVGTLNEWSLRIDILPEIQGTTGNDVIVVHLGTPFVIVDVNGKESRIASEQGSFSFDALGGHDQITIYGSAGDDSVIVRDSQVQLDSAFSFFGQSIEDVKIFGGGGHDIARIYGSQRDEVFRTFDGGSSLVGDGFKIEMMGYDQTSAFARGGNDAAYFVDSAGNDRFFASTIFANLKTDNAVYNARDFETVAVHSSHGGFDIAQLFGGSGDDELFANPGFASLKAGGEKVNVAGFSRTWTHGGGGNDIATLIGSAGNDVYNSRPNSSYLYGDGYFNQTVGFEVITANADSGEDQAIIYDTPGDDTFYSTPTYSVLFNDPNVPSGTPFRSQANGFDKVSAIASSAGFDQATFIDSAGNDRYVARDSSAFLIGDGFLNFTQFFNSVTTRSTGGADVAIFHSSIEDDRFFGSKSESYLRGSTFFNRAMNFKNVTAYLDLRGLDIATLHDSEDDDTYIGTGSRAVLFSDNYIVNAIGADLSIASSLNGGTDKLATGTIDYELRVNGNWT
jgi:subtilisin-like proprotein convertase family protein